MDPPMPLACRSFWLLAALLVALLAAPLYLVDVVPLLDYPAHLTRVTLLSNLPLDPLVARAYTADIRPLANLAMDLVVPALAPLTGPALGLKLFITTGLALWLIGAALIYRGLWREWSVQPLAAAFFALNPSFFDGYFNFHFAAGLALTGAGLWLTCRHRPAFLLGMASIAVALLFSHLMAVAILGLLLGSFELGRQLEDGFDPRRLAVGLAKVALVFVPAALLWLFVIERGPGGPVEFHWLSNLLGLGVYSSQFAGIRFNAAPIVLLFVALFFAWRLGRLSLARRALPAVALTYLAALVMPSDALGGAGIHIRLPAIVGVLLIVATRINLDGVRVRAIGAALVAILALGSAVQSAVWIAAAAEIDRVRAAWRSGVPEGARLATALGSERDGAYWHVVDLAVLDRKASVAALFTTPGQSTLRLNPAYARFSATNAFDGGALPFAIAARLVGPNPPKLNDAESIRRFRPYAEMACDFDYLLLMGARPDGVVLPPTLSAVAGDDGFTLFHITPPPGRPCQPR
jgi:hypothetical protein